MGVYESEQESVGQAQETPVGGHRQRAKTPRRASVSHAQPGSNGAPETSVPGDHPGIDASRAVASRAPALAVGEGNHPAQHVLAIERGIELRNAVAPGTESSLATGHGPRRAQAAVTSKTPVT